VAERADGAYRRRCATMFVTHHISLSILWPLTSSVHQLATVSGTAAEQQCGACEMTVTPAVRSRCEATARVADCTRTSVNRQPLIYSST